MRNSLISTVAAVALIGASAPFAVQAGTSAPEYQIAAGASDEKAAGQSGGDSGSMYQEGTDTSADSPAQSGNTASAIVDRQGQDQALAGNLIGTPVRTSAGQDGQEIGQVNDLVLGSDNRIEAVVIGVGGFLGVGEKNVAVKWEELEKSQAGGEMVFVSKLTREQLEQAQDFTTKRMQQEAQGEDGGDGILSD